MKHCLDSSASGPFLQTRLVLSVLVHDDLTGLRLSCILMFRVKLVGSEGLPQASSFYVTSQCQLSCATSLGASVQPNVIQTAPLPSSPFFFL